MNKYYQKFKEPQPSITRDPFFRYVIDTIISRIESPKILTIGATHEKHDINSIQGQGWADFYFADHLMKVKNGSLTIVDIDPIHIDNCKEMMSDFINEGVNLTFHVGDGINFINDDYDVIYLDGSDDPNEMYNQYKKINRKKSWILADDWNSKGIKLGKQEWGFLAFHVNWIHQCAIYPKLN